MRKSRFTENEMVRAVKQLESGMSAEVISRELGISRITLYKWKSKYSGMEVSQVRRLKELEEENRKLKHMYADLALDSRILEEVISSNGKPDCIRTDNGPEFISEKLKVWCLANGIEHKFTQPGKPTQNSYIERFNGSYRRAVLDAYIFKNPDEVRFLTGRWRTDYNNNRPHEALGNMTPIEYKQFILNKNTNFDVNLCAV